MGREKSAVRNGELLKVPLVFIDDGMSNQKDHNELLTGRTVLILLALFALTTLAPSCSSTRNGAADHATLKIGFFGDLTGPTFNFGLSAKNGEIGRAHV